MTNKYYLISEMGYDGMSVLEFDSKEEALKLYKLDAESIIEGDDDYLNIPIETVVGMIKQLEQK